MLKYLCGCYLHFSHVTFSDKASNTENHANLDSLGKRALGSRLQVQGKLSIACYLTAVDKCYARLCQKVDRLQSHSEPKIATAAFSLADIDYCVMHVSSIPSMIVSLS